MTIDVFRTAVGAIDDVYIISSLEALKKARRREGVRTRTALLIAAVISTLAALFSVLFFALRTPAPKIAATVYFDASIGVELTLGDDGKALTVAGTDGGAPDFLDEESIKGKSAGEASRMIAEAMIDRGYLSSDEPTLMISVDGDEERYQNISAEMSAEVNKAFAAALPEGTLLVRACSLSNDEFAKKTAQVANRYLLTVGKASLVVRLTDRLGADREKELADLSVTELRKLCIEYGISDEELPQKGGNVLDALLSDLNKTEEQISIRFFFRCSMENAEGLVEAISIQTDEGKKYFYFIDPANGRILEKFGFEALNEEQAKIIALRFINLDPSLVKDLTCRKLDSDRYFIRINSVDGTRYFCFVYADTGSVMVTKKDVS